MNSVPDGPHGHGKGYQLDPSIPGEPLFIFGVFFAIAWVLPLQQEAQQFPLLWFLLGASATVVAVKAIHELIHWTMLSLSGVGVTLGRGSLNIIPEDAITRRGLILSVGAPVAGMTPILLGAYIGLDNPLFTIFAGFALAVHTAISVPDIILMYRQLSVPAGSTLHFRQTDNALNIWVYEPT